jgi:PEP-CTERM/exosortase A-associated glycosyltransferase
MKILHVLHNSLPLLCGYSIRSGYIVNLQRTMGLQPWVVSSGQHPNGPEMRETIEGVEYRRTAAARINSVPFLRERMLMRNLERQVESAAREVRPDIIHAHSPVLVGLPALRVAKRLGLGFVYEIRDLWENAAVDRGRFGAESPMYRLARRLDSYVLSRADAVVTICDLLKAELQPRVGRPERVHVVPNGVDAQAFAPQAADNQLKERWKLAGKEVILYAGTFQPYEGLDLLVRAIGLLARNRPSAHLVIVGGSAGFAHGTGSVSEEERELRAVVRETGVADHVTFTGRIPHAEVKGMYAMADVVAYPRRLTRTTALTTPLKPLEAMAMAKPVVVSDVAPMLELVSDGQTGVVFRAGDVVDLSSKLAKLLRNSALREHIGQGAREWVLRERQWPNLISRYQDVYRSVAKDPRYAADAAAEADIQVPAGIGR